MSTEEKMNDNLCPASTTTQTTVRFRDNKTKKRPLASHTLKKKMTPFERRYSELGESLIPEKKRIDYVLIHPNKKLEDFDSSSKRTEFEMHEENRKRFEIKCKAEGLRIQKNVIGDLVYTKLHVPFKRLCLEAERINMELPLKGCEIYDDGPTLPCFDWIDEHFETDCEIDFVSAPFMMDRIHIYENYDDPSNFFRPAVRSYLTHIILINMDIRQLQEKDAAGLSKQEAQPIGANQREPFAAKMDERANRRKEEGVHRHGLPYLLMKGSYTDSIILHDESETDPIDLEEKELRKNQIKKTDKIPLDKSKEGDEVSLGKLPELDPDHRKELDSTWPIVYKFQPLWKVRNYFGEKISLYFAWSGQLIASLWIPALFGLCIFFFGISESVLRREALEDSGVSNDTSSGLITEVKETITTLMAIIKEAFDNRVTPYFALIMCLWGTVFLEFWKRKNATLSYEWDVDQYENNEPDRPQFYGIKQKPDPVTKELNWFYPVKRKLLKYIASFSMLLFMVVMVFISVVAVIVYRVIMNVDFCPSLSSVECLFLTSIVSSILNAVSILILGKFYDKLAIILTEWENHRTQTSYDDALILKLFGFQFANSYTSCFYIAFFRGRELDPSGILGLGSEYTDSCTDNNCMAQLSFQVLVLMVMKPFPKFFKDIIMPFLWKLLRKRPQWCCHRSKNKVDEESGRKSVNATRQPFHEYLERERAKPALGDFTLGEYTEKVILYGYLMLFAASFPLAPLIAIVTLLIDIRVDAKRLLWWYRRPIAFVSQDLGMWYSILTFVNVCGVVSNAFLIAFTSSWGHQFGSMGKLWVVLAFESYYDEATWHHPAKLSSCCLFEATGTRHPPAHFNLDGGNIVHIVFAVKFLLAYMIPDVPSEVQLAIRREKYQVNRIIEAGKKTPQMDFAQLIPTEKSFQSSFDSEEGGGGGRGLPPLSRVPEDWRHGSGLNNSHGAVSSSAVPLDVSREDEDHLIGGSTDHALRPSPYSLPSLDKDDPATDPSVVLSYGKDGTTYVDVDEKFPDIPPPSVYHSEA